MLIRSISVLSTLRVLYNRFVSSKRCPPNLLLQPVILKIMCLFVSTKQNILIFRSLLLSKGTRFRQNLNVPVRTMNLSMKGCEKLMLS